MQVNPYPIKLAYEARKDIQIPAVAKLLRELYRITLGSRQGMFDMSQFQGVCLAYCAS